MSIEIECKFLVRDHRWRAQSAGSHGWLSAKAMQPGPARPEFEYAVPAEEAMLAAFAEGPVVPGMELVAADEDFPRPPWLGDEVTDDGRFDNFRLATAPFSPWPAPARASVATGRAAPGAGA